MPVTGKIFMAFMMMGMMVLVISVILHFVAAGSVGLDNLEQAEDWAVRLEAFRRLGVGLYLFGIAFGLGTIIHVLRFQAIRIRGLAGTS
jgi:TRAP-type C4-dicarboxylate transport system permease large subunit